VPEVARQVTSSISTSSPSRRRTVSLEASS
jgi:hypothetical protein